MQTAQSLKEASSKGYSVTLAQACVDIRAKGVYVNASALKQAILDGKVDGCQIKTQMRISQSGINTYIKSRGESSETPEKETSKVSTDKVKAAVQKVKDTSTEQKVFSNSRQIKSYFGKDSKAWQETFSDEESESVFRYYTGDHYIVINSFLRGTKSILDSVEPYMKKVWPEDKLVSMYKGYVDNIDSAIERFELKDPIKVYRGCTPDMMKYLKVGEVFEDKGFMSTALTPDLCRDWVEKYAKYNVDSPEAKASGGVIFEIDVPSGKGIGMYYDSPSKGADIDKVEFTLRRGSKLRIKSIEKDDKGYNIVKAEVIKE